jgi:RimJ/RimL family protein N-acetyltransferase
MRIERVDPADAGLVRACHAVHEAAAAVDDPLWSPPLSLAMYSAYVRHDWPGDPAETWYLPADPPGPAGDADRVRDRDDIRARFGGNRSYAVAAVRDATGEMAALTRVSVDPAYPAWGYQGITAVTRPHRGHRLGLLTKAVMLEWLMTAEPGIERIETTNVQTNSYMIAVNEALGYELAEPGLLFFAFQVT